MLAPAPMHWAWTWRLPIRHHTAVVKALIAAGANREAADKDGNTPMHKAARRGDRAAVYILVEAGARVCTRNRNDQTPLDLARQRHRAACAAMLQPLYLPWTPGRRGHLVCAPPLVRERAFAMVLALRRTSPLPREVINHILSHCRMG